jgi:hypothetical protein
MAQTLSMNRDISTKRVTHLVPESVRSYTRKCELHKNFFKPNPLLPLEVLRRVEERQMAKSRLGVQRCYRTKYVTVKPHDYWVQRHSKEFNHCGARCGPGQSQGYNSNDAGEPDRVPEFRPRMGIFGYS